MDRYTVDHRLVSPASVQMGETVIRLQLRELKTCGHDAFQSARTVSGIADCRPAFHQRAVVIHPVKKSDIQILKRIRQFEFQHLRIGFCADLRGAEQRHTVADSVFSGGFQCGFREQRSVPCRIFLPDDPRPLTGTVKKVPYRTGIRNIEHSGGRAPMQVDRKSVA